MYYRKYEKGEKKTGKRGGGDIEERESREVIAQSW